MKRVLAAMLIATSLLGLGCQRITSGGAPETTPTGELWYSKETTFFFLPMSATIHYCPPPATPGTAPQCIEAEIVD